MQSASNYHSLTATRVTLPYFGRATANLPLAKRKGYAFPSPTNKNPSGYAAARQFISSKSILSGSFSNDFFIQSLALE